MLYYDAIPENENWLGERSTNMCNEIVIKDIKPTLTLTHLAECTYQTLPNIIYGLHDEVKKNIKGSFICIMSEPCLKRGMALKVYCPVESSYAPFNSFKYKYEVLQRTRVVSTIQRGGYDQVEDSFEAIARYIEENNLTMIEPYRLVFHKEKRKWQRKKFFKKSTQEYIIEIQVQIKDDRI